MFAPNKTVWDSRRLNKIFDPRNIGLYIFLLIVFAIVWSGVKTLQTNYELQKKISLLKQQNAVIDLQNQNTALQNQYFSTDQYLDLAARQDLGLAGPGEQVFLVPKATALKYIDPKLFPTDKSSSVGNDNRSTYVKNLEDWRDFLLGRKITGD